LDRSAAKLAAIGTHRAELDGPRLRFAIKRSPERRDLPPVRVAIRGLRGGIGIGDVFGNDAHPP
jgi:hypothetical protein